jgi:hypothetical protein
MVTVKKISVNELPKLIQLTYEGDSELFQYLPGNHTNYMTSVNGELINIYQMAKDKRLRYYKVIYQKKPIGYFVTFENHLYSFAINIKFRKKDILLDWWKELKKTLNKGFSCQLEEKNERAIKFLEKNNMKVVDKNEEHKIVTLINC